MTSPSKIKNSTIQNAACRSFCHRPFSMILVGPDRRLLDPQKALLCRFKRWQYCSIHSHHLKVLHSFVTTTQPPNLDDAIRSFDHPNIVFVGPIHSSSFASPKPEAVDFDGQQSAPQAPFISLRKQTGRLKLLVGVQIAPFSFINTSIFHLNNNSTALLQL